MSFKILLSATFIATSMMASAQEAAKTYVITGESNGDFSWRNVRQVDLSAGKMVKDLLIKTTPITLVDGKLKKEIASSNMVRTGGSNNLIAAAAFDKRHNKLFFSGMQTGELKWIDVTDNSAAVKVFTLQEQKFTVSPNLADESANVTRMCIGADGDGYAVSNDGNHFYRFTTGKTVTITDLGNLVDADDNKTVSIHNKCSCWGGDMVADAYGKLYIITASHNVFTVDPATRIAKHIGTINGLPAAYSTNGAAVIDDENIMVSSANNLEGFYKVNIKDLSASKMEGSQKKFSASDLANGNLLFQQKADAAVRNGATQIPVIAKSDTRIYPNPAIGSEFKVLFDGQEAGRYTIVITDLAGRTLQSKNVTVDKASQAEPVKLARKLTKGFYMVKVLNAKGKTTFSDKVLISN